MEKRIFTDVTIPAYFQASNKPFKVIPQRTTNGQVEFSVEGQGIDQALDELYANAPVGVLDFIRRLEELRSSISPLKRVKHDQGRAMQNRKGLWDLD